MSSLHERARNIAGFPTPRRSRGPRLGAHTATAAALLAALLCGCALLEPDVADVVVPEEHLRTIQPLRLRPPADTEPHAAPVPETTPPAEVHLTLSECRMLALENNLQLQATLLSPTVAATSVTEAEARFEALFVGDARLSRDETPTATDPEHGSKTTGASLTPGFRLPLRSGGSVSLETPLETVRYDDSSGYAETTYATDARVSVTQPLLRGAGRRTNAHAITLARLEEIKSEALTKLEVIQVLAAVDRLYWRLYAARQELAVRRRERELAEAQRDRARRQVEAGTHPQIEILRTDLGVAERLEAVIVAENALRERERELKRIIRQPGLELDGHTVVLPATEPELIAYRPDADALADLAIENRMELLEMELRILQDLSTINVERNHTLPLVSLGYTYNVNGLGETLDDSLELLFEKRHDDHILGLQVEIPLGNAAARGRLRRAFLNRQIHLAQRNDRREQVRQEVYNAVDRLEAAWQRVLASRQRVVHAERLAEAEQRQFDLGLRTSTEVLETQARLADASSAEIRALAEYQIAQVDLAVACGMLTAADRVRWEPRDVE